MGFYYILKKKQKKTKKKTVECKQTLHNFNYICRTANLHWLCFTIC